MQVDLYNGHKLVVVIVVVVMSEHTNTHTLDPLIYLHH